MYYFNEAATLFNAGDGEDAVAAADKAIAADPTKADAYYIKGQALIQKATVDPKTNKITAPPGCVEAYQKYLELQPTGPRADEVKGILQGIGATITKPSTKPLLERSSLSKHERPRADVRSGPLAFCGSLGCQPVSARSSASSEALEIVRTHALALSQPDQEFVELLRFTSGEFWPRRSALTAISRRSIAPHATASVCAQPSGIRASDSALLARCGRARFGGAAKSRSAPRSRS